MLRRIITILFAAALIQTVSAQNSCTITGKMDNASGDIKKVYLVRVDEYERIMVVDSAKVKKGKYKFNHKMTADEPVMLHLISGFENTVEVFVEPGKVNIDNTSVSGSVTNDLYAEYKQIDEHCLQQLADTVKAVSATKYAGWEESAEGLEFKGRMTALMKMQLDARRLEFLLENRTSPLAPLMMQRDLAQLLSETYATQLMQTIPTSMNHPYRRALFNAVLSEQLRVGNELPDISIPLCDGTTTLLSDYRGKYVLLDFWASWCTPCMREMPHLKDLYDATRESKDKFVIISYSLDNKEDAWKNAISSLGIDREGWVHASDLMGKASPVISTMKVQEIPYMILIDPEGKAISFALKGDELKRRVKQILGGDLYYLDQKK